MSSFNRPPRPFQFPAYDSQADYASPAVRAGSGASFGASPEGFAPAPARAHAQQAARPELPPLPDIYAPRGVYAHRDTYAPQHAYAPYDPAPVDPLDPHAPTHSWLDLELIPSWLRPFTIDANTRFTRTPDLYLRPREAEPQAVLAGPAVTETAPPPDISGRSWHFVLDPADDEPPAPDAVAPMDAGSLSAMAADAPDADAWGGSAWGADDDHASVHPAAGEGASGGDPLAVAMPAGPAEAATASFGDVWEDPSAHTAPVPDAIAAFAPLPQDGTVPGDAPGDHPVAFVSDDLPVAFAPGDLPVAIPSGDLPVASTPEGMAADVTATPTGEEIPMIEMSAADTPMDAPVMEMQTAGAPFGQPADVDAPLALSGPADPEPAEAPLAPLAPHLQALTRLLVLGHAAEPPAPALDQDLFPALATPLAADGPLPADAFEGQTAAPFALADDGFTDLPADASAMSPVDVADGMALAPADTDLVAEGFLPADAFEAQAPAAPFALADDDFTDLPADAAAMTPADVTDGMALAPAGPQHIAASDLAADGFLPADAFEGQAPTAPFIFADHDFTDLPADAAAMLLADVTDGMALALADTHPMADANSAADGFLPAGEREGEASFPLPVTGDDALPPAIVTGEEPADLPPPDESPLEPAPLPFGTGGAASLWSPYQQLVTAHFLGGAGAFAPAGASGPAPAVPAPLAAPPAAFPPAAPAMAEAVAALADAEDAAGPAYDLPPLDLLREPPVVEPDYELSEEFLDQSSTMLQQVLRDFGVRGEVIDANPGPVVTLYEFEPAPGVKSSRVIGLSPDIARSMSAISARVAVVEGRNVIGIELPNRRRETVWLRELLASHEFAEARPKLGLCLGKTIGGAPVIADLARMPHLLVAGTTGSGKSVAINTMILSLLYRHTPEACRLIMIDPKMLELSIYEGIPHLLTPVVTDPKKAIIALKWAVKEMEERYKKMSRLAVRNIDGYNARVKEAAEKGEVITRNVQVGFDKETGEALFEEQEMDLTALPYIVVIVDEMADLMMVAGKEIEGAIQRLAQMARAAGIHLVMATQRPSVDVITGTIKANFPTRISFQVTSKIDSRTILGEMGAETLLGQGDMLFMAGGGRITRVHGPFVSDAEVEHVVAHLKAQGGPDYLDAVVLDEEAEADDEDEAVFDRSGLGEAGGDLYEQAVAIVMRDRKASTSYIQRRLQVGYNKAASLMERMETEGIVGPANHAGKREILTFSRPG